MSPALHRFSLLTTIATFFLILAGASVTSTRSGLAVPDWPLSYGQFFPPMTGGVFYEHGHRMIAGTVGLLATGLMLWVVWRDPRRWVRLTAIGSWFAVLLQAVLGGITVLYRLPKPVSIAHACLAQTFFCLMVLLTAAASPSWRSLPSLSPLSPRLYYLKSLSATATAALYVQLVLGASLRHHALGILPHAAGAVLAALLCLGTSAAVLRNVYEEPVLPKLAYSLMVLVSLQVLLGVASTIGKNPVILATAHVGAGALLLGTSVALTSWVFRLLPRKNREPALEGLSLKPFVAAIGILFLLPGLSPGQESHYRWGLPIAASTFAPHIDSSLRLMHGVMAAIFILWALFMAYCLIRYRHREGARASYAHKGMLASFVPDALILLFDVWLIFFVGLPIWSHVREDLPSQEQSHVVEIVAEQFAWNIHYPGPDGKFGRRDIRLIDAGNPLGLDPEDKASRDDVVTINELRLPMGKPTLAYLTSKDVIHSFFVPEFRVKQDAVPGMRIPIWFEPTLTGKFEIGCAQLCGLGHFRMRGDVLVESPEEYRSWYKAQLKEKKG